MNQDHCTSSARPVSLAEDVQWSWFTHNFWVSYDRGTHILAQQFDELLVGVHNHHWFDSPLPEKLRLCEKLYSETLRAFAAPLAHRYIDAAAAPDGSRHSVR